MWRPGCHEHSQAAPADCSRNEISVCATGPLCRRRPEVPTVNACANEGWNSPDAQIIQSLKNGNAKTPALIAGFEPLLVDQSEHSSGCPSLDRTGPCCPCS